MKNIKKFTNKLVVKSNDNAVLCAWYLNYPWDSRLIKGRHNGGLIYFGGGYKHCQHDLADH